MVSTVMDVLIILSTATWEIASGLEMVFMVVVAVYRVKCWLLIGVLVNTAIVK